MTRDNIFNDERYLYVVGQNLTPVKDQFHNLPF